MTVPVLDLINFGSALEMKARGKTSEAIKRLIGLQPKTARVIRNGKEIDIPIAEAGLEGVLGILPYVDGAGFISFPGNQGVSGPAVLDIAPVERNDLADACRGRIEHLDQGSVTQEGETPIIEIIAWWQGELFVVGDDPGNRLAGFGG